MTADDHVPLGEICAVNPRARRHTGSDDDVVTFVPMAAVDSRTGTITVGEERRLADVATGFTAFEEGDVLFAKITPCMQNGKAALARNLTNGVGRGSTEFYVLRPGQRVLGEYIWHFVRQPRFREAAKRSFTGTAGQQRVPRSFMENAPIPLPPLEEQRRIVDILNRAARIGALRQRAADKLREFAPALFIQMFGDPDRNPMRWSQRRLDEVCAVQGGLQVSKRRSVHSMEAPYLRVANVLRDQLALDDIKLIRLRESELVRTRLVEGDLLIVEGHGNATEIGRVAVWDGQIQNCVHQNHLIRARPDQSRLLPEFAAAYLNSPSGRQHLLRRGKTTSGLNTITTSDVGTCGVFLPPLDRQRRFAKIVEAARALADVAESRTRIAAALMASLTSELFGSDVEARGT